MMFVCFVVGDDGEDHRCLTGVITEARLLRDENLLAEHENVWLEEMFDWFYDNVPVPPYSSNNGPKGVATHPGLCSVLFLPPIDGVERH